MFYFVVTHNFASPVSPKTKKKSVVPLGVAPVAAAVPVAGAVPSAVAAPAAGVAAPAAAASLPGV